MIREQMHLGQWIISNDPKDAAAPQGYVFAFRGELARVVFTDNAMRDVELSQLVADPDYHCDLDAKTVRHATRKEQHGRYIDCGPQAWDDQ